MRHITRQIKVNKRNASVNKAAKAGTSNIKIVVLIQSNPQNILI